MLRIDGPTLNQTNLEIVTPAAFKLYLQAGGTKDDVLIATVLDSVHRIVHRMIGDRFLTDLTAVSPAEPSHDYLLSGQGNGRLQLPQWPVGTITSVRYGYVDGTVPDTDWVTTYTYNSNDYYSNNDTGTLHGVRRGFPRGYNNMRVIWTAGYATVPEDLVAAINEFAAVVFKRAKDKRWDQLSIGDQSQTTTYARRAMTDESRITFNNYAPEGFGLG